MVQIDRGVAAQPVPTCRVRGAVSNCVSMGGREHIVSICRLCRVEFALHEVVESITSACVVVCKPCDPLDGCLGRARGLGRLWCLGSRGLRRAMSQLRSQLRGEASILVGDALDHRAQVPRRRIPGRRHPRSATLGRDRDEVAVPRLLTAAEQPRSFFPSRTGRLRGSTLDVCGWRRRRCCCLWEATGHPRQPGAKDEVFGDAARSCPAVCCW
jgi:hypothetical protein